MKVLAGTDHVLLAVWSPEAPQRRAAEELVSEPPARLVLLAQDRHETGQSVAGVEAREDEGLLQASPLEL